MKKRLTRLLAICVCLIIVLSACASAPSGESTATEESKATSVLELSDEESSEIEPSTPEESSDSQPVEPTYPEERETTLEKLATFETGKEGLFEYGFVYETDPSDPTIELPFICAVDQNGKVYADTKAGVVCLNDGANLYDSPSIGMLPVLDMIVCGGDLFVKDDHGDYHRFSLEKGLENASLVKTYHNEENTDIIFGSFVDVGKDEPIISYDGTFYSLDGKQLSDSQVPYVYSEEDADMTISKVRGQSFVLNRHKGLLPYVYSASDGVVYSFSKRFDTQNGAVYETICFCYDAQGALQSQFMIAKGTGSNVECEIAYGDYMLRSYQGQWISVGKTVFEGVLNSRIEAGKNGEFYLIVYYANYGEVYKINPGYSDVEFTEIPIEPTYPEERETTLELVREYPLGEGGIPFYLLYENDPTIADIIVAWFLADENGNIYAYNGERFYDLQNKTSFVPPREERLIARELAIDGKLYCLTLDGTLNVYSSQGEKVDSVRYPKRSENGTYDLFVAPDGTPHVAVDGVFYNETGKKIVDDYTLGRIEGKTDALDLFGKQYTYKNDLYVTCYADGILTAYDTQTKNGIDEYLIYQYDKNGDPLSEFMIYRRYHSAKIPCNISYEGVKCTSYSPVTVEVGKQRFDNLIDANWFVGADGTIYLMLIDPEGGKLYKINPGYSDVEFTEIPIEPTYPEERETTLELVREYPLGEGGIPFALFAGENPEYVMPHVSDWFFADEKGDLYAYNGQRFYDFQTGGTFRPSDESQLIVAEVILDGKWYCMTLDGIMNIYTDQGEKIGSVKYPKISEDGIYTLLVSPDGKLHIEADGVFYDETGKKTAEKYTLDTAKNGGDTLSLFGRTYFYDEDVYVQSYADGVLTACESRDYRMTQCPDGIDHSHIEDYNEVIFYQYDKNGDPLSEFMILFYYSSHKIPCNLVYEGVECKEYAPKAVIVGKHRFDNLIDANWFVGADGTIYLMLIDPEGGKLYKINPGYSDVTPIDFDNAQSPMASPDFWEGVFAADVLDSVSGKDA